VIGRVILVATSLVIIGILTRHLGVSGFGIYATAFAFAAFFGIFADLGFFFVLVREISIRSRRVKKVVANVMTIRLLAAFLAYTIGFGVAWLIPSYDTVTCLAIGITAGAFFWQTIQNTLVAIFQANFRMDKAVLCDLTGRMVILGLIIYLVNSGAGLLLIMTSYIIGNVINFSLAFFLARRYVRVSLEFDFKYWKKIILEALPLGVAIVLNLMYFKIDTVMLSMMQGTDHVGIYGPSYKILEVILILPGIFIGSVLPIYSRYIRDKDSRLKAALQKAFDFLAIAVVPIVTGIFLLSDPIIKLIAGTQFLETGFLQFLGQLANSSLTLKILIFSALSSFLAPVFIQLLVAGGYQRLLVIPNIIFVLLNVILNAIFIPMGSYVAAAFTTIVTEAAVLLTFAWLVWKVFGIYPRLTILAKALLSGGVMGAVVYYLTDWNLLVVVTIGAVVYLGMMWAVRGINKDMMRLVFKN
jgi:O-antigen/teichoic acid export membrane protein